MKTYEKPRIEMIELRENESVMAPLALSATEYDGRTILSNRRRDQWSNGWDD